jgi:hypothetical protein
MTGGLSAELEHLLTANPKTATALAPKISAAKRKLGIRWTPNPGPQTEAYFSQADILLYGGQAGGGKSDLGLGLAFNEHRNTLVMRREGVELGDLLKRAIAINGTKNGFNGSPPPKLITEDGRQIDFGSCKNLGDETSWQGRPHDLIFFDETVNFLELQIRFLTTWLRTTTEGQRTRIVMASNPPIGNDGQWLVDFFAPWLDVHYPNPALPGELRWVITDEDDRDQWVDGPEPVEVCGRLVQPKSRTFIPASVADNPFLAHRADYRANLDSLPEPYRSAFRDGNFMVARKDSFNQAIPTAWVREAMARWTPQHDPIVPMCAIGVDPGGGGSDERVIAPRFDGWYAPMIVIPGDGSPSSRNVAGEVVNHRFNNALVIVDLGGGWGSETYAHLKANEVECVGYLGVEPSNERTSDRRIGFRNKRSAAIWQFREALDPSQPGGSPIMLPNDPMLLSDLTAPTFEITPRGIEIETKESVVAKLGRSPNKGDAVVMAWQAGPKASNMQGGWQEQGRHRNRAPKSNLGPRGPLRRNAA